MENTVREKIKKNVSNLIRSGILFPNREEGEKFIGMTIKSWLNLQKEEKIVEVYDKLNIKIKELFPTTVTKAIDTLVKASQAYVSQNLWKGRKKQSKQKYALKLFYKIVFQEYHHIYQTLPSAVIFDEEEEGMEEALLNALDNKFMSAFWFILIGYEVINPFLDISRPRKNFYDGSVDLAKYLALLIDIVKYWPVVGSLSSFHEIEIYKTQIESSLKINDYVSPFVLIGYLQNLYDLVEIRTSPDNLTVSNDNANFLIPEGIWIDESDLGKSRFWIFPINLRMIFCYSFEYGSWHLNVHEAISDYDDENEEYVLTIISPEESKNGILNGKLSSESIHEMRVNYSDESGEYLEKLEFHHLNQRPQWFDFDSMMRLDSSSELHTRFLEIINKLYNLPPLGISLPLINPSAWMTDASNCLIGMDEKYIYLKDKGIVRHILKIAENLEGEYYQYLPIPSKNQWSSLFGIKISDESPLYIISRNEADYPDMDPKDEIKKMIDSPIEIIDKPKISESQDYAYILRREAETYRRFKEAVFSTPFPGEITIYAILDKDKEYKKICFNKCGVIVDLDKAISLYGMKKITSLDEIR
ncbi:MAG: hypothetical protein J1E16_09985 [Muribaculaceae bacterium]|nr:hypothetical protein [Muribaculaceae bacterium]